MGENELCCVYGFSGKEEFFYHQSQEKADPSFQGRGTQQDYMLVK